MCAGYVYLYIYNIYNILYIVTLFPFKKRKENVPFSVLGQGSRPLPPLRASAPLRSRTRSPRAAAGGGRRPQRSSFTGTGKWMENNDKWMENGWKMDGKWMENGWQMVHSVFA